MTHGVICTPYLFQHGKLRDANDGIVWISDDVEPQFLAHRKHRGVLPQDLSFNGLHTFRAGVINDTFASRNTSAPLEARSFGASAAYAPEEPYGLDDGYEDRSVLVILIGPFVDR